VCLANVELGHDESLFIAHVRLFGLGRGSQVEARTLASFVFFCGTGQPAYYTRVWEAGPCEGEKRNMSAYKICDWAGRMANVYYPSVALLCWCW